MRAEQRSSSGRQCWPLGLIGFQLRNAEKGDTVLLAPLTEVGEGLRTVMELRPSPAPFQPWM